MSARSIDVPGLTDEDLPFPTLVRAGDWVHLSGQVALDTNGELVGAGDVGVQTTAALRAIQLALDAVGGGLSDIVSVTAYLASAAGSDAFDASWRAAFGGHRPARTALIAPPLDERFLVELQAIAWVPGDE